MNKFEIRAKYKKLRIENDHINKIYDKSLIVNVRKFLASGKYSSVGIYYPILGEPDMLEILDMKDIKFSLPKTIKKDSNKDSGSNTMSFHEYKLGDVLDKKNNKIICEPLDSAIELKPEILLIPGIAFDKNGFRIGFGFGYYDRYLSKNNGIAAVGVCYSYQITEFNHNFCDVKMDKVITENIEV